MVKLSEGQADRAGLKREAATRARGHKPISPGLKLRDHQGKESLGSEATANEARCVTCVHKRFLCVGTLDPSSHLTFLTTL